MEDQLNIITERIDDVVLLLHMMMQMGLPDILNEHLPRHWKQQGLDWGWVIVIWLSYILSEGDHRKVVVRDWVQQQKTMIAQVCGLELRETDFSDDRLGIVLSKLSEASTWQGIETSVSRNSIRVYPLPTKQIRLDATTVSSHHLVDEDGLFQFGHSKDDPSLAQLKLMQASLDPLGMPLATWVVSGEQADDGLYLPIFEQVCQTLESEGLLYVGDCKMGAVATRAQMHAQQQYYLVPLARVGKVAELLEEGLAQAQAQQIPLQRVHRLDAKGQRQEIATGYELSRQQEMRFADASLCQWTERILLVHSPAHAHQQSRGLEHRVQKATEQLKLLTPAVARGKRQVQTLEDLHQKIQAILKAHRVEGCLEVSYEYQPAVGKRKARYQITQVIRNNQAIEPCQHIFGWRVYVTNAPLDLLCFEGAVLRLRDSWIQEHGFARLKGKTLGAVPLFVQKDDQAQGLMHLLSLGLRVLTLIEFVVHKRLAEQDQKLSGLSPGNPTHSTCRPTAEKILKAFCPLTLTILKLRDQEYGYVSPLNSLQAEILQLLGFSPEIYLSLAEEPR